MKNHPTFNKILPISDEAFIILIEEMRHFLQLNAGFIRKLKTVLYEVNYKKDHKLLINKERQEIVWFLIDGVVKETNVDTQSDKKTTVWFWFAKSFIYVTPGFFDREPSQSIVTAGYNCRVIFISYEDWKALKDTFDTTDTVTEKIRGAYNVLRREHASNISTLSITERYIKYKDKLNLLFPHFSLKDIAEYMGMSADRLSGLRKTPGL